MDINLLVLGIGNSRLALGVFAGGQLVHSARLSHRDRAQWPQAVKDAWAYIADSQSPAVAAASVHPDLDPVLGEIVQRQTAHDIQWVGREIDPRIRIRTRNPAQTGIDRILNIAAAYEQMQKACVVVDAGTAITVDCCNDQGEFLGGAIAPGLEMMLDALHEKTARLPRVTFTAPLPGFGDSTAAAISLGAFNAIRGLVRETVENYATHLGSWPDIIATGGDAQTLFAGWELIHAIAPDLLLYGIALAYSNYQIERES
jgi:type III pantothenate kinase